MRTSRRLTKFLGLACLNVFVLAACGTESTPRQPTAGSSGSGGSSAAGRGGSGGGGTTGGSAAPSTGGSGGSNTAGGGGAGGSTGGTSGTTGGTGGGTGGSSGTGGSGTAGGVGGSADASGSGGTGGATSDGGVEAPMGGAGGSAGPPPNPGAGPGPGWTLRWGGGMTSSLDLFEGQETSECSHGGTAHASVAGANIRIDSHYPVDTDCNGRTDRARNELKGMKAQGGGYVSMKRGETWLIQYDMFIPDTLDATSQFSHIYQIFAVAGTSAVTGPVVTMTLHQHAGMDSIELRIDGNSGPHFSPVPLAPIQNKWVTVQHEVKWDSNGSYRWAILDGERVHVNATRPGWNGWHGAERMRPKWGIYRNKGSAGLQTTHLLLNNFRAYQKD